MAAPGRNIVVHVNGRNLTDNFRSMEISQEFPAAENTVFGNLDKSRMSLNLRDGSISLGGFFDAVDGEVDAELAPLIGTGDDIVTVLLEGDTEGNIGYACKAHKSSYTVGATTEDLVKADLEYQGHEGIHRVEVLHTLSEETSTDIGNVLDEGAATSAGMAAFLHVSALDTGTFDLDIEESADNSSFSTLASFTQVTTAEVAEKITSTGSVARYIRLSWTLGGGASAVTFAVTFSRKQ